MAITAKHLSAFMLFLGLLLAGCQTMPPQTGLTPQQITVLQEQGFVHTDTGWAFGMNDKLLFPSDESQVDDIQKGVIARITRALLDVNITRARVEGHTDSSGSAAYNLALSRQRAGVVADIMIGAGMQAANLQVEGLGDRYPVVPNTTARGRQENRRVSIIITN